MAVWDWFLGLFNKDGTLNLDVSVGEIAGEVFYKDLAVQACVNLIANAVARSEFLTYEKGKEVRKENYYLFNVEPNLNKSASKFWRDVIHRLIYDNECLVIQEGGSFYVAESFSAVKFAFKENIYKDIVIEGYGLKGVYVESQVFHFELHDQKIRNVIESLYKSYSKLIAASSQNYKRNNTRRGTLEVPSGYPQTDAAQTDLEDLLSKRFKRFFNSEGGAVLPLTNGLKYDELPSNIGVKGGADGREVRAFVDDIFDFAAIAFQVPPQLLRGSISNTSNAVTNLLTFCVNPIAEILQDEINRKLYRKELYLDRTYTRLDTSRIKAIDIKEIATSLDVLFRIGANTINDNLRILGREPIDEPWANERFVTKNYQSIEHLKGGE